MKILAFAATNSRQSINRLLVSYAADLYANEFDANAEVEVVDLNDYEMPIYSIDRESESGIPLQAQRLLSKIRSADAVFISFAEHNGSYSAAYKNIFDWMSRIDMKVYADKQMVLLATSPGPGGGQNVLNAATQSMPFFGGEVISSVSVGGFGDNFDVENNQLKAVEQLETLRADFQALQVKARKAA